MTVTQSKIMDHFLWINSCQEFIYFCSYFAPDIHYHIVIYAENIVSQILFLQRSTLWELGIKSFKDSHLFIHLYEVIYNCILTYIMQIMDNAFDSHLFDIGIGNKIATFEFVFLLLIMLFFCCILLLNQWLNGIIYKNGH